jgi:hypothetical protein
MAEPSETPPENPNSNLITTIQPTTKLGGRGTPRRKILRSNSTNHSAMVAARTLENKLKTFRTQFQLQDQQDLCDITILYDDGRVEIQNQVQIYSTWPMTIHEIDSSEKGTQTYHINELDSTSSEYLLGNIDHLQKELNPKQSISLTTNSSNYYNDLQQRQAYSQPSRSYMNYIAYKQNPYAWNSYENYSNNIREVYGGTNAQSEDEHDSITKTSKRKRRRRKHAKTTSEQLSSIISQQEEVTVVPPIEHLENENVLTTKPKRKRRRIRKSKKSLPSSSITSIVIQQPETNLLASLTDEKNEELLLSSVPSTQHAELMERQQLSSIKNDIHANGNVSTKDVMNVKENDEQKKEKPERKFSARTQNIILDDITPTVPTHIPTVVVDDVEQMEDENEKITLPANNDASVTTISTNNILSGVDNHQTSDQHVLVEELDTQQPPLSDHIQVNIFFVYNHLVSMISRTQRKYLLLDISSCKEADRFCFINYSFFFVLISDANNQMMKYYSILTLVCFS